MESQELKPKAICYVTPSTRAECQYGDVRVGTMTANGNYCINYYPKKDETGQYVSPYHGIGVQIVPCPDPDTDYIYGGYVVGDPVQTVPYQQFIKK